VWEYYAVPSIQHEFFGFQGLTFSLLSCRLLDVSIASLCDDNNTSHTTITMKTISIIRHLLSHLLVASIAFQFGLMTASTKCIQPAASPSTFGNHLHRQLNRSVTKLRGLTSQQPLIAAWKNMTNTTKSQSSHQHNTDTEHSIHGMAWVPRDKFSRAFDLGIPIENMGGRKNRNQSILMLYMGISPDTTNQYLINTIQDPIEATEHCEDLSVIITDRKRKKRCIAIMENWGASPHVYRFWRNPKLEDSSLIHGGRFHSDNPGGGTNRWQKVSQGSYICHVLCSIRPRPLTLFT
jgi:hypothetical protein